MKHLSAIAAALIITIVIGFGIFVIGVNALTNTNTVPLQNSPNTSSAGTAGNNNAAVPATNNVQQLQQEVSQLQSQLSQDNQAIQQYQSLLMVLQQRGIIVVDRNGNIYLPNGG